MPPGSRSTGMALPRQLTALFCQAGLEPGFCLLCYLLTVSSLTWLHFTNPEQLAVPLASLSHPAPPSLPQGLLISRF